MKQTKIERNGVSGLIALLIVLCAINHSSPAGAAELPTDKPANRKIEDFYDNSLLEELDREGLLKTLAK